MLRVFPTSCSQLRLAPEFILGALLTISPNPSCAVFNDKHWQLIENCKSSHEMFGPYPECYTMAVQTFWQ